MTGTSPPRPLPCGSWPSPITSELLTRGSVRLGQVGQDGDSVLWVEGRPEDDGRQVLVRRDPDGSRRDLTASDLNVRTRVQEYGGMAWAAAGGEAWFSDFGSGRIHQVGAGGDRPRPITPEGDLRYADLQVDRRHGRLLAVLEDHTGGGGEPVNAIAAIPLAGGAPEVVAGGHDFAAEPRVSPDGGWMSWVTWDHPAMPWTSTALWVAPLDGAGGVGDAVQVAGGPEEAVLTPRWAPDGSLWFSSDAEGGWWNLWRRPPGGGAAARVTDVDGEIGFPPWVLGFADFAFLAGGDLVAVVRRGPVSRLHLVDQASGTLTEIEQPYTELTLGAGGGSLVAVAASPSEPAVVVAIDPATGAVTVLRRSAEATVDAGYLSTPRLISFASAGGRTAHAVHYPPANAECDIPVGERPPLRVLSHGGPTAPASTAFRADIQFFTSRGFAVVDVDYGGSTGYGRPYRELLNGAWGIVDVEDCAAAVRHLAEQGLADPGRVVIQGGSAGGFTTMASLVFTDVYAAGCSHFGVGDLRLLAEHTHKFESRYLDGLVGPWPQAEAVYRERSPLLHADRLRSPVVLFQGLDDRVVPPEQSEAFFEAARANGLPCAYVPFEGEQHGFRIAENIRRCLDGELWFYSQVLDFAPADELEPLPMENAPDL